MRNLPWILAWAATLIGAWYLGRETASVATESGDAAPGAPGAGHNGPALTVGAGDRFGEPAVRSVAVGAPLKLEGAAGSEEVLARLLAYVAAHLPAGTDAHLDLYRTLDRLRADGTFVRLLDDGQEGPRSAYPLLKFFLGRAEESAAFAETVLRTAAEQPLVLDGTGAETFDVLVAKVAPLFAGALGEPRLHRLRGYVQAILDRPDPQQPAALRGHRNALQGLLLAWSPVIAPEEALARLKSGQVKGHAALPLLRRTAREERARLDLVALLGPVVEAGDVAALTPDVVGELPPEVLLALDTRLVDASARLKTLSDWHFRRWLEVTGRPGFDAARGFLEQGLRQGGGTANATALVLLALAPKPTPEQVDQLLKSYDVDARVAANVRRSFGIK